MNQADPTPQNIQEAKEIQALALISDLVYIEVIISKQANRGRGRITKKSLKEEKKAITELFLALTGRKPTEEEIAKMV